MHYIENIIDKYYFYSKEISWSFSVIFITIIIYGFIAFKENRRYISNKLVYKAIYSVIISGIGELLCLMGLTREIEYVYFNAIAFIYTVGAAVGYGILLSIMFKQITLPLLQSCRYVQFVVYLELFLLAITKHLGVLEWIAGTLGIVGIEMLITILKKLKSIQIKKKKEEQRKEDDYPNSDLYPTRKRQLDKFVELLAQLEQEPYAIMISGEWGTGKTSFVKRLEKELSANKFIWISAGSEKTVAEIMSEISAEIVEELEKNNIFIERKDLIEKYFLAFSDLLTNTALEPLKKISSALIGSENIKDKEYLNSKLDDLDKTVYLIIDDLDRCNSKYQAKMFKVIRESMELHHCKTIFLVDRIKFLNKKYDANYIEKYVSYTLDVCEVDYQEIVKYLIVDVLEDKFIQKIDESLLSNRNTEQIREIVYSFPINLIERLEEEVLKEKDSIKNKKENEIKISKEKVEEIGQTILKIKKDITVSRKVKSYLKGVRRDIDVLNDSKKEISKELLGEDWIEAIIRVQFLKNFMPEVFKNIKMSRSIFEFGQRDYSYSIDIIFDLGYGFLLHNEKKEALLNFIIYKIDILVFSKVETKEGKYLVELRNNKGTIKNIGEYIKTYDDLDKILDIYSTSEFNDSSLKENFIYMIFEVLSQQSSSFKANTKAFLNFSKCLMESLLKKGLSDKEKIICVSQGNLVIRRTIVDNARLFINILSILFDVTTVADQWNALAVSDIDEFYGILLKIDREPRFKGLEDDVNKLLSIKTYYWNLKMELQNKKYKGLKSVIDKLFTDIDIIFEICEFWDNIEYTINDREKEESAFLIQRYFLLDNSYTFREEIFYNISDLIKALEALKEFYITKENSYDSNYTYMLLRLSYRIILKYEESSVWFGNKKKKVATLLKELAELVCKLDEQTDYYAKDAIVKIKIYTYKLNGYCESEVIE